MRNLVWLAIIFLTACQTKPNLPPTASNQEIHARHFQFNFSNRDTTLLIFLDSDTLKIKRKQNPLIYLGSTTLMGYFQAIQSYSSIAGVVFSDKIKDTVFQQEWIQAGKVIDLNPDHVHLNKELLLTQPADYFLYSPFDGSPCSEIDIPTTCLPICDYMEHHPLAKLEWIKVIGYLVGKYQQAEEYYQMETTKYLTNIRNESQDSILFGSFDGVHFWINSKNSHIHTLIQNSGHYSVFSEEIGNAPLDREALWEKLTQVKYVILMGSHEQRTEFILLLKEWNQRWKTQGFYMDTDKTQYFETGCLHPSLLLKNLAQLPDPGDGYLEKVTE
jgi:hypothetical protein